MQEEPGIQLETCVGHTLAWDGTSSQPSIGCTGTGGGASWSWGSPDAITPG